MRRWIAGAVRVGIVLASAGALGEVRPGLFAAAQDLPRRRAARPAARSVTAADASAQRATLDQYCVTCHNERLRTARLALDSANLAEVGGDASLWEKVVTRLRTRTMPPAGGPRPDQATYDRLASWIEAALDRASADRPNPGRTATFHRLNRAEYQNAVRDLLALDVDVTAMLPGDDIDEQGFDNMAEVLTVSPALFERYLSAARRTARLAVGRPPLSSSVETYKLPLLLQQDDRMSEDLPFGSRGGLAVRHQFPTDGEYEIKVTLQRNYVNYVRGLGTKHDLELRLDGALARRFSVGGESPGRPAPASFAGNIFGDPEWEKWALNADADLKVRLSVKAGPRLIGVSFVRRLAVPEGVLQPRQTTFAVAINDMRDGYAAVEEVAISGPYRVDDPGDTPSRRRVFVCRPRSAESERSCARQILSALAKRAYRRAITQADIDTLLRFYEQGRGEGSFDAGIQLALERLLISPDFLFRVERDPLGVAPAGTYALDGFALASRLSFFLWSSIPDGELLGLAERGRLAERAVLDGQVRRMLADSRAEALVDNFAGQWLRLRDLKGVVPDPILFPEFDENLRDAFRRETELLVASTLRENRSVLDLLNADYTFVNERLARHYGLANVYGAHFRRVALDAGQAARRGGILGHGSILTVTSYPNRTSPVLRGKWVLTNILGTPPPPPPADVPGLPESGEGGKPATVRDRMERHRRNPACAACHAPMDPLGLALENYDPIGTWRAVGETRLPIDASGALPDGSRFVGPSGLRDLVLERKEQFVGTLVEKLLAYALGRRLEHYDRPVVRQVVRDAARDNYRWSAIIGGIAASRPFQMRRTAS
jgi:mono/diheme cytochrome c family protein